MTRMDIQWLDMELDRKTADLGLDRHELLRRAIPTMEHPKENTRKSLARVPSHTERTMGDLITTVEQFREFEEALTKNHRLKGHFGNEHEYFCTLAEIIQRKVHFELLMHFLDGMKNPKGLDPESLVGRTINTYDPCPVCGRKLSYRVVRIKGKLGIETTTKCKYPQGYPEIIVELAVPSGEILLFNDFREVYGRDCSSADLNTMHGIEKYMRYYEKKGMAIVYVGNTCPDVHQKNKKHLMVGSSHLRGRKIGNICTDLWWYCAVDKHDFEKKSGKTVEQYQKEYNDRGCWPSIVRTKVTPGVYTVSGRYHLCQDRDGVYSEIKLKENAGEK